MFIQLLTLCGAAGAFLALLTANGAGGPRLRF